MASLREIVRSSLEEAIADHIRDNIDDYASMAEDIVLDKLGSALEYNDKLSDAIYSTIEEKVDEMIDEELSDVIDEADIEDLLEANGLFE